MFIIIIIVLHFFDIQVVRFMCVLITFAHFLKFSERGYNFLPYNPLLACSCREYTVLKRRELKIYYILA